MKHIYKRNDSWYYQFVVRGVRYNSAIGNVSKTVAQEYAEKLRLQILEGKLIERTKKAPRFGHYDSNSNVFTDAAGEYLTYYKANRKPSSAVRTGTSLTALAEAFGD